MDLQWAGPEVPWCDTLHGELLKGLSVAICNPLKINGLENDIKNKATSQKKEDSYARVRYSMVWRRIVPFTGKTAQYYTNKAHILNIIGHLNCQVYSSRPV